MIPVRICSQIICRQSRPVARVLLPSSSATSSSSSPPQRRRQYSTAPYSVWPLSSGRIYSHRPQRALFSSSGSTTAPSSSSLPSEVVDYLNSLDIDATLHTGIVRALESMHGKGNVHVDQLKAFGPTGMQALAASVDQQNAKLYKKGGHTRPSVNLLVKVPHHSTEFQVLWRHGDSLLEVAQQNMDLFGEYNMEGTCGGNASCCTCHVYVEQAEMQLALDDPDESELDMLDLAYEPTDDSRLGCQVRLTPEVMQVCQTIRPEIILPSGVNNVWS